MWVSTKPGATRQPSRRSIGTSRWEIGLDRGDAAVADADVDEPIFSAGDAGGAQDEIERHRPSLRRFEAAEIGGLQRGVLRAACAALPSRTMRPDSST